MIAAILILVSLCVALAAALLRSHRARAASAEILELKQAQIWQLKRSEQLAIERLHAVSNSALRGCPAVKWQRPQPVPAGADANYWRIRIAGEYLLLTEEQFRAARQRADHLLHPVATH
jgi:hypothetical protein